MRVLLLTADQRRHRWTARRLAESVTLAGVVIEAKATGGEALADPVLRGHFEQRDRVETELLGDAEFPEVARRVIPQGSANSPETADWVERGQPDLIVLYGTGVIRQPLLERFGERMINLHLGLSPWYRGAGTNFWPFVFNEPECVGATIHRVAAKVDAGDILCQVRPEWRASDGIHQAGTKALMSGVAALPRVIEAIAADGVEGMPQDLSAGRVFRQSDFNADAVRTARENLLQGTVGEYVARKEQRDRRFPLVEMAQRSACAGVR